MATRSGSVYSNSSQTGAVMHQNGRNLSRRNEGNEHEDAQEIAMMIRSPREGSVDRPELGQTVSPVPSSAQENEPEHLGGARDDGFTTIRAQRRRHGAHRLAGDSYNVDSSGDEGRVAQRPTPAYYSGPKHFHAMFAEDAGRTVRPESPDRGEFPERELENVAVDVAMMPVILGPTVFNEAINDLPEEIRDAFLERYRAAMSRPHSQASSIVGGQPSHRDVASGMAKYREFAPISANSSMRALNYPKSADLARQSSSQVRFNRIGESDNDDSTPRTPIRLNVALRISSEYSESEAPRYSTAEKGKFPATRPPVASTSGGIVIRPDPDSREGAEAALIEYDRQTAMRLQEKEDLESARRIAAELNTAKDQPKLPKSKDRLVSTPMNPVPAPVNLAENQPQKTPQAEKSSRSTLVNVIRQSSEQPGTVPISHTPRSVPASLQIPSGTYLARQLKTPSKPVSKNHVPNVTKLLSTTPMPAAAGVSGVDPPSPSISSSDDESESPDPSDSSEESSSDSASTRSHKKKSSKKKRERRMKSRDAKANRAKIAAHMKLDAPKKWNGEPSIEKLEEWLYEINQWYDNYDVPAKMRVSSLSHFLEGNARRTFMSIVSSTIEKWTLDEVIRMFLDELFPSNIREILRERFDSSRQGSMSIRAWLHRIRNLSARIDDVSEKDKARQFWKGARPYIRIEWAGQGYSQEFSSLEDLLAAGELIERKEKQEKAEKAAVSNRSSNLRSSSISHSNSHHAHKKDRKRDSRDERRLNRDNKHQNSGGPHRSSGGHRQRTTNSSKSYHYKDLSKEEQ
ncbi:hypothetical protein PIIN_08759 [Serendipita indica DSM 11827]|uniref:Retrotransposon gag domain-containing protein n=1 Tax=Serendipita indica (strain DSM 11827) TaxID=1109443 RepID=G4TTZ7_SERID|nr:hypothetical protein PIIN_08759 [Serendipita indica DSM 11827]